MGGGGSKAIPPKSEQVKTFNRRKSTITTQSNNMVVTGTQLFNMATHLQRELNPSLVPELENVQSEHTFLVLPGGNFLARLEVGMGKVVTIQCGARQSSLRTVLDRGYEVPNAILLCLAPVVGCDMELFDRTSGLSVASIEDIVKFNHYNLQRKTAIMARSELRGRIRTFLTEGIMGPKISIDPKIDGVSDDDDSMERPHFGMEASAVVARVNSVDDMVEWAMFEEKTCYRSAYSRDLGISANFGPAGYGMFADKTAEYAHVTLSHKKSGAEITVPSMDFHGLASSLRAPTAAEDSTVYKIPKLGVTVVETAPRAGLHASAVIWVNGSGIFVDPPVDSKEALREAGLPNSCVDKIILTSCKADDGAFQRIFNAGLPPVVITTRTIMTCFLERYQSITGFSKAFLEKLMTFHEVKVKQETEIEGAKFTFHYALDAVCTLSFDCSIGGKGVSFVSGHIIENPNVMRNIEHTYPASLVNRKGQAPVPLMLISGTVTPEIMREQMGQLVKAGAVKQSIALMNASASELIKADFGDLSKLVVQPWQDIPLAFSRDENSAAFALANRIKIVGSIPLIAAANSPKVVENIAKKGSLKTYEQGDVLCEDGKVMEKCIIVLAGAAVEKMAHKTDGSNKESKSGSQSFSGSSKFRTSRSVSGTFTLHDGELLETAEVTYAIGDLLGYQCLGPKPDAGGRASLVQNLTAKKHGLITAASRMSVIEVTSTDLGRAAASLEETIKSASCAIFSVNEMLSSLPPEQKTFLFKEFKALTEQKFKKDEVVVKAGEVPEHAFILTSGSLQVQTDEELAANSDTNATVRGTNSLGYIKVRCSTGAIVGDMNNLLERGAPTAVNVTCSAYKASAYMWPKESIQRFVAKFTGTKLKWLDRHYLGKAVNLSRRADDQQKEKK